MCNCNKKNRTLALFPPNKVSVKDNIKTFNCDQTTNHIIPNFSQNDLINLTDLKIKSLNLNTFRLEISNNDTLLHNRPSGVGSWSLLATIKNSRLTDKNFIFHK